MILKKIKKVFKKEISYSLKDIYNGHHNITYRGVLCIKCPFDYITYQMIINQVKPDLIIEIGTNEGGSTLYLADLLEINGVGEIHSIDIEDKCPEVVKEHKRINLFFNGWENYDLDLAKGFKTVLVIEDSSHHYKNTLDAINKFAPLVTKDSYLIVEDGILSSMGWSKSFDGGPVRAIEVFIEKNKNFKIDNSWENFFGKDTTFNPKGFLKRI
ncbi:CmcI family methyltransferase [Algoriphagus algorifonticola]|uniref:CmcI family methyltransferase n=1 Tax=Algoriphagus algorifonticola TaxID=2593007 RepID=UPI001642930D|nr:CmcI family methyltransferase [Algoriphagus algorifonticola]